MQREKCTIKWCTQKRKKRFSFPAGTAPRGVWRRLSGAGSFSARGGSADGAFVDEALGAVEGDGEIFFEALAGSGDAADVDEVGIDGAEALGVEVAAGLGDDAADAAEEGDHVGGDAVADEDGAGVGAVGGGGGDDAAADLGFFGVAVAEEGAAGDDVADDEDADGIKHEGAGEGDAGADDDAFGDADEAGADGDFDGVLDHHVGVAGDAAEDGGDAPLEGELALDGGVGGDGDDDLLGTEGADDAGGVAVEGGGDDGAGADVFGEFVGAVGDGAAEVGAGGVGGVAGAHVLDVFGGVFGGAGDEGHGADGFDGVFAAGGLAGEHEGVGAVEDGVGDVGEFGAGGARIDDHRVEHLGGGDDGFAGLAAAADDGFLGEGDAFGGELDAEVAAGDHDAVGFFDDGVDVVEALFVFDFGDDAGAAAEGAEAFFDADDLFGEADEAGGDKVDVLGDAEGEVFAVSFGEDGKAGVDADEVDVFAAAEAAAVGGDAVDAAVADVFDGELDEAVGNENAVAGTELFGGLGPGEGNPAGAAVAGVAAGGAVGGDGDGIAGGEEDVFAVGEAGADFGAFGVEEDGDGDAELGGDAADAVHGLGVPVVGAVGEVEAGDVHAGEDHGADGVVAVAGGADGTNYLRFAGLHGHGSPEKVRRAIRDCGF